MHIQATFLVVTVVVDLFLRTDYLLQYFHHLKFTILTLGSTINFDKDLKAFFLYTIE
jgi:hypothetical protein